MKKYIKMMMVLIVIAISFTITNVSAVSRDVMEENDNISIPYFIYEDGTKITVYDTEDYKLYGQWIKISMEDYNEIIAANDKCQEISDEAKEYSNANRPEKENFATTEAYNEAVKTYNAKIKEYNSKLDTCEVDYYNTFPDFDNNKWEELIEDKVYWPEDLKEEKVPYILYIKLEDKTNNITDYDLAYLIIDNEKTETEEPENPVDDTNWKKWKKEVSESGAIEQNNFLKTILSKYEVVYDDSNENEFIITITNDQYAYEVIFNYQNGIVTYNAPTEEEQGRFQQVHKEVVLMAIYELADVYGYEKTTFMTWLNENKQILTLADNGIEFKIGEYTPAAAKSVGATYIENVKFDIANGIKGYTDSVENDKVTNPDTGDMTMVVVLGAIVFVSLAFVSYRKLRNN